MFILTYCIVCTLFTGLFTCQIKSVRLISIFVLIFMLLSLSAFVRFFIKETACLLAYNLQEYSSLFKAECRKNRLQHKIFYCINKDYCSMICTLLRFLFLLCLSSLSLPLSLSISACAQAAVSFSFGRPKGTISACKTGS